MKAKRSHGTALLICLVAACASGAFGVEADDVAAAAAKDLPGLLAKIPAGMWSDYGFADADETAAAALGEPMPMRAITPAALAGYRPGDSVGSLLSATTLWYVPVAVEGSVRAVLVVDRVDGAWQAVSLGYAPLAAALNGLFAQWPPAQGYHPKLVMVAQAQQYLYTIPELGEDNLTPLGGAGAKARTSETASLAETVASLKPSVARNLSRR